MTETDKTTGINSNNVMSWRSTINFLFLGQQNKHHSLLKYADILSEQALSYLLPNWDFNLNTIHHLRKKPHR